MDGIWQLKDPHSHMYCFVLKLWHIICLYFMEFVLQMKREFTLEAKTPCKSCCSW